MVLVQNPDLVVPVNGVNFCEPLIMVTEKNGAVLFVGKWPDYCKLGLELWVVGCGILCGW